MNDIGSNTTPDTPTHDPVLELTLEAIDEYRGALAQQVRDLGHDWLADEVAGLSDEDAIDIADAHEWLLYSAAQELISSTKEEDNGN